jgi:hypothetical protein
MKWRKIGGWGNNETKKNTVETNKNWAKEI